MKKIFKEHNNPTNLYQTDKNNQWEEIKDPYLQTAARAGCYGDGFTPNATHPDPKFRGMNTVLVGKKGEDDIFRNYYFTPRKSKNAPDHTLVDIYSGATPNEVWTDTRQFKCKQLEKMTNPTNLGDGTAARLTYDYITTPPPNGLGYKKYGDVTQTDFSNYKLVELLKDPDLQPNGLYYNQVSNIQAFLDTMAAQKMVLYLWKPSKKSAPAVDIVKKQTDAEKYFKGQGYTICQAADFEDGSIAKVDLYAIYGSAFEQNTFMCKPWSEIGVKKADCITAIDSYYEEIKKYQNSQGATVTAKRDLGMMKNQVNKCLAEWYDEKGFKALRRRKKMEALKSLRGSSPFFLGESTDRLTNIIRESLSIVKIRKNSI
jgi:hypothetical protein